MKAVGLRSIWVVEAGRLPARLFSAMKNAERIAELEKELAELKAHIPKHSVRPHMIIRIEEVEEEIERLKQEDASAQS